MLAVVTTDTLEGFKHDDRVATDNLHYVSICCRGEKSEGLVRTTIPNLTFSPPSFSSTASSRTMFRKTYAH
jgi:hypothetical protein